MSYTVLMAPSFIDDKNKAQAFKTLSHITQSGKWHGGTLQPGTQALGSLLTHLHVTLLLHRGQVCPSSEKPGCHRECPGVQSFLDMTLSLGGKVRISEIQILGP